LGDASATFDFAMGADGRPTGVDGVQFQFSLADLTASATGDADDIIDRLQLFASNAALGVGGGSGEGPVKLFDPNSMTGPLDVLQLTSVQIVGDQVLVSVDPSYFASDSDLSGDFSFRFGYENYATVNSIVGLGNTFPIDVVTPNFSNAFATFSAGLH